ncbi:MAG: hypothetical protein PUA51_08460, partial [Oscillospiraceae bacterium]|nr:hypothetical protein [Oscillospiraceae bacterium]
IQNNIPPVNNPIPPMNNIPPVNNPVPPMNNTQNNIPPVSNPVPPMNNIQNNIPPVNNPIPPMNNIQNNIPPVNNPVPPMNNTQNNIPPVNNPIPPMNNTQNNIPPVSNPIPPMNNIPPVMPKSNINISYLANESRNTPSAVANAIAQSTKKKNLNLFDMQENPEMPTIFDSPEAAFSQLSGEKFKKKEDKKDSISTKGLFEEYKAPSPSKKKSYGNSSSPSPKKAPAEPQRPLSKEELKAKKRQEKIDAKFKKDLAKRGF